MRRKTLWIIAALAAIGLLIAFCWHWGCLVGGAHKGSQASESAGGPSGSSVSGNVPSQSSTGRPIPDDSPEEECRTAELVVRVFTNSGTPIAGAKIFCLLGEGSLESHERSEGLVFWLDSCGTFHGPDGDTVFQGSRTTDSAGIARIHMVLPVEYLDSFIELSASAPGFVKRLHDVYALNVPGQGETKEITIELEPGRLIKGRIHAPGVKPEGFWVHLGDQPAGHDADADRFVGNIGGGLWYTLPKVRDDYSFEAKLAPFIPLRLYVETFSHRYLPWKQDLPPSFEGTLDIILQPNPAYVEKPQVTFALSNPPADGKLNCILVFFSSWDNRNPVDGATWRSCEPLEMTVKKEGVYDVYLISNDEGKNVWARKTISVPARGTKEVSLTLEPAARIRLRMTDKSTGKPPSTANIKVNVEYPTSFGYRYICGDKPTAGSGFLADGILDLYGVPPGNVRLVIDRFFDRKPGYKRMEMNVTTVAGEQLEVDVSLEPDEAKPPPEEE